MAELPDRDKREQRFARALGRLGSIQCKRLEELLGNPPNLDNVPESFWKESEDELAALLLLLLIGVYSASARLHGMGAVDAKEAATDWATKYSAKLARDFTSHTEEIIRARMKLWDAMEAVTKREIREGTLMAFGPKRMERMAVTETSSAQHHGAERAIDDLGIVVVNRFWRHSRFRPKGHAGAAIDPCPICTPRVNTEESEWGGYVPGLAHPHCDCYSELVGEDGELIGVI